MPRKKQKQYNFSSRKKNFTRERDRSSSPSSEEQVRVRERRPHNPPSPSRQQIRAARRIKERPTCILFGPYRETIYPDYFFCHPCKMYEDLLLSGSLHGLVNRHSRRYRCTADHTDYFLPTQLKKTQYVDSDAAIPEPKKQHVEVTPTEEEVNDAYVHEDLLLSDFRTLQDAFEGCQAMITNMEHKHALYVESLKEGIRSELEREMIHVVEYREKQNQAIIQLKDRIKSLSSHLNYYKKKADRDKMERNAESIPLNEAIVAAVNDTINSKQRYKMLSKKNKSIAVAKAVFHPNFANGIALDEVINESKNWLRKNVFTPSEILKQMDLRGGTLNYEGITVLNDVEASAYKGTGKRCRGRLLCTPSCLQRVAKALENKGDRICPFKWIQTKYGEGIEFDYAKVTRLVVDAFGLQQAAKERNINVSASIDAARVTKNICHTSAGLKMTDIEGRDPLKLGRSFIADERSLRGLQSQNTIFLLKIILTKETKESFKLFDDVFQFFRLSGLSDSERSNDPKNESKFKWEYLQDMKPLNVTTTTDMAADWKLVGAGGGVKQTEMFCNLCTCASSDVHQPNQEKCDRFCHNRSDDPSWMCYHHPIYCSEVSREQHFQEAEALRQVLRMNLEELSSKSKIRYYVNPTNNVKTCISSSIDFQPSNDDERDSFMDLLMEELMLRGLNPTGELEELRERLRPELILEYKLQQHLKKLTHCSRLEASLIALLLKIPCILHCENRVGLKILTMLLREGFSNTLNGTMFGHIKGQNNRIMAYAQEIERIINTVILGDDDGPAQWILPMDKEQKNVGIICLDNNRIRKILSHFETLVAASVTEPPRAIKYNMSVSNYRSGMCILRQRSEFTDDNVKRFQNHIDTWFQIWNQLHSMEGCTNYTHMLSSGHITEYMLKWRNMYRFSQQGWEKFNHIFTTVYFWRTNHGGRRHESSVKSKLLGIGRWLQRRLLWMTGTADKILLEENINYNNDLGQYCSEDESSQI